MSDRLVTLAKFPSVIEAALARNVLQEGGIPAQLTQDAANWMLSGMFESVKLMVRESDVERADALLDEALAAPLDVEDELPATEDQEPFSDFAENLPDWSPALEAPAWKCAACGVRVEETDRRCWSCGTTRTGEPNPYFVRGDSTLAPPPREATDETKRISEHVANVVDRAWRAALVGILLLPPLPQFYSAWLLLSVAGEASDLPHPYNRKYYLTLAINLVVSAVAILCWRAIFSP
jgi:hypothetical protein